MNQRKIGIKLKILIIFLIIAIAFTIASRAAAAFTVAQVRVEDGKARKIRHTVTASGQIEAMQQFAVVTEPDLLVAQVFVKPGQQVTQGDILFVLDEESIAEKIHAIENEIEMLKLQNASLESYADQARQKQETQMQRAREDYDDVSRESSRTVSKAGNDLDEANYAHAEAKQELQSAKDAVAQCERELEAAKAMLERCRQEEEQGQEDASHPESSEKTSGDTWQSNPVQNKNESTALAEAQKVWEDKKIELDELNSILEEKQSSCDAAAAAVLSAEGTLDAAKQSQQESLKAAKRSLEDAEETLQTDPTASINEISIQEYEQQLQRYQALQDKNGQIDAPYNGTVIGLEVQVGQKTPDTACMTLSDDTYGRQLTIQIPKEDAAYITVGDAASVQGVSETDEDSQISAMQIDASGEFYIVTVELSSDKLSLGENVTMTVDKDTQQYACTVPVTALMQENNRMYVLVLDTENTVLGEQYVARKAEVTVLDKNSSYAALDGSGLSDNAGIIVDTDRYVEAGARVRLMDP